MSLPVTVGPNGTLLTRGTEFSAGLDLYASEDVLVGNKQCLVKTDICVAIPEGHVGLIRDRSSMAYKNGVAVLAGVIDADYRGPVGVVMFAINRDQSESYQIRKGDRIAQMIVMPFLSCTPVQVENLNATVRGDGGYGSTGK